LDALMTSFRRALLLLTAVMSTAAHSAGAETLTFTVGGQPRTVMLERPAGPGPHPTIIVLHGAAATFEAEARSTQLLEQGPRQGYAVAFPQGLGLRWNFFPPGRETDSTKTFFARFGGPPDDLGFLKTLVADLVQRGIADPKRTYLVGRSLGGAMALRLACTDASMFAGIALLISAMPEVIGDCAFAKPLPALVISGTADPVIPYRGGLSRGGDNLWPTERLVSFFRKSNGCSGNIERSDLPLGQQKVEIERSNGCAGAPVAFYRMVGGGHDVPLALKPGALLLAFFGPGATPSTAQIAKPRCTRLETRMFTDFCNGCTKPPFNQQIVRTGDEWTVTYVDGNNVHRTSKYNAVSETAGEILMYDGSRNIQARLDLKSRTGFVRRGQQGDWTLVLNILNDDCS
jgi:polyhydroxybutyrate depolymerase